MNVSEKQAIELLQNAINEIDSLKRDVAFSKAHTKWLTNVLFITEEIFGQGSRIYLSIASLTWRREGSFIVDLWRSSKWDYNEVVEDMHHEAYLRELDTAKGLLEAGIDQINLRGIDEIYKSKNTPKESSEIVKIIDLAENKLRKTIRQTPKNEREVQDKFEDLLVAKDVKYLREQEKIVYSSKTYHPDFCFPRINTVLEIKLCDDQEDEKSIISEINDDIVAYKTKYPNIIFVVYDLGYIRDIDKFKEDIEAEDSIVVKVVKH